MWKGRPLTIETTGRPQANEPPWHEPRWSRWWTRRPSRSWWPIRRLWRSSHARRLWWPPWWLPSQRWRLPWRLPWRPWSPSRRLQPLLSNDQREERPIGSALFEAFACRHYAVSLHARQVPTAGKQQQRRLRVCHQRKRLGDEEICCFHYYYHSCVCYSS